MSSKKGLLGAALLIGLGAGGTYVASHVKLDWGAQAKAAPGIASGVATEVKPALPPPSPSQLADARSLSRTFAQVASQVSPSVVRINITKTGKANNMRMRNFKGTPFERFFGGPDDDEGGGFGPHEGPKQKGMGSGVLIDGKGHILTNNHVVEDADDVKVTFVDGKTAQGKVVGTDPKTDLAVVKVDSFDIKPAKLGDSDKVQIGEWVMAIGNPLGFDHTVTVGVLSARGRSNMPVGPQYSDFLQTDASINPGNSGGPLVTLDGEVIGINTMIAGIGTGIGFAVPSNMARPIVDQLISSGRVRRPYLGILMQDVNPEIKKSLGGKAPDKGALVSNVQPGSPADKAGVKPGDVITSVEGMPVDGSKAVQRTVLTKKIGQKLDLQLWRDGQNLTLAATTAELDADKAVAKTGGDKGSPKAKLGLALQPLTPDLADRLGLNKGERGVVVSGVRDGGPASEAGVREGDVIVEVDRKAVTSVDDANRLLSGDRQGGHLLRIKRGDGALFLVVPN
jgi:serine protease Do